MQEHRGEHPAELGHQFPVHEGPVGEGLSRVLTPDIGADQQKGERGDGREYGQSGEPATRSGNRPVGRSPGWRGECAHGDVYDRPHQDHGRGEVRRHQAGVQVSLHDDAAQRCLRHHQDARGDRAAEDGGIATVVSRGLVKEDPDQHHRSQREQAVALLDEGVVRKRLHTRTQRPGGAASLARPGRSNQRPNPDQGERHGGGRDGNLLESVHKDA